MKNSKYSNSIWNKILTEAFNPHKDPFLAMFDFESTITGIRSTTMNKSEFEKFLCETDVPVKIIKQSYTDPIFSQILSKVGATNKIPLLSFFSRRYRNHQS